MTDIEKQALALVNEIEVEFGRSHLSERIAPGAYVTHKALCRAIEKHEKFKWEVSYAVLCAMKVVAEMAEYDCEVMVRPILDRFIIAKPDPLIGVCEEAIVASHEETAQNLRAALAARGLEIREVGHD